MTQSLRLSALESSKVVNGVGSDKIRTMKASKEKTTFKSGST